MFCEFDCHGLVLGFDFVLALCLYLIVCVRLGLFIWLSVLIWCFGVFAVIGLVLCVIWIVRLFCGF